MNFRLNKFNILVLTLMVLISSCEDPANSSLEPINGNEINNTGNSVDATYVNVDFIFPTLKEKQTMYMEAQSSGTLYIDDNCFKINRNVIIWPYNYSVQKKDNNLVIYDNNEEFVASEGDSLYISGGQVNEVKHLISEELSNKLPSGPYWVVGESVENITNK